MYLSAGVYDRACINATSSYLQPVMANYEDVMKAAINDLRLIDFDTFVVRGLSGLLIGPPLSWSMEKLLLVVRKSDRTHGNVIAEGQLGRKWIFFDDFISEGKTKKACREAVEHLVLYSNNFSSEYIGSYEYHYRRWKYNVDTCPSDPRTTSLADYGSPVPYTVSSKYVLRP